VYRRFAVAVAVLALVTAFTEPLPAALLLLAAGGFELVRGLEVRRLSPPTRALLADDRRARRWKPHRWHWRWATRLRPWWWLLLSRLPPPVLLAANAGLLGLAVAGGAAFWVLAFAIALPFSLMRSWRWYRRRHPGASSWRPPA
jgi:hypothetical protein